MALEQQKAEAAKAIGELQQQQLQKERWPTPTGRAARESLKTALAQQKAETAKATGELQQQRRSCRKNKTQTEQAKALEQRLVTATAESAQAVQQRDKATQQADKTATELAAAHQAQQALREELDGLRSGQMAAGYAVAQENRSNRAMLPVSLWGAIFKRCWRSVKLGINPDKIVLLAGVIDTFNGHYQLSDAQLTARWRSRKKR